MVFFLHGVDTPCEDPKNAIQRVGHRVRLLDDGKQESPVHVNTRSEKRVSADRVKRILLRKCTTVSVHPNWNCLRSGGLEQAWEASCRSLRVFSEIFTPYRLTPPDNFAVPSAIESSALLFLLR